MRTRSEKKRDRNNIGKNFRLPVQKKKNQKQKPAENKSKKSAKKIKKETDNKKIPFKNRIFLRQNLIIVTFLLILFQYKSSKFTFI